MEKPDSPNSPKNSLVRDHYDPADDDAQSGFTENYVFPAKKVRSNSNAPINSTRSTIDSDSNKNLDPKIEKFKETKMVQPIDYTEDSWVEYYTKLPTEFMLNGDQFNELWNEQPEERKMAWVNGKEVEEPRWSQTYGPDYLYAGKEHKSLPITPTIKKYLDQANKLNETPGEFNAAYVNWFQNGEDYSDFHSDDDSQMIPDSPIYIFSFGADRYMILRNRTTNKVTKFKMKNNTLNGLCGKIQSTHDYAVPKDKNSYIRRISIVLRKFKVD